MSVQSFEGWFGAWPRWLLAICAALLSALLYYFGTGLEPIWPLAWLAPLPVLFMAFRSQWWWAMLGAFVAYASGKLYLVEYGAHIGRGAIAEGIALWAVSGVIPAVAFTLVVLIARFVVLRVTPSLAVFAFPAAWAAYECVASTNRYTGALFATANSQTDFLVLLQSASIAGAWGVTFLVALLPSALATPMRDKARHAIAPAVGVLVVGLLFGGVRLIASTPESAVRVALVGSATKTKPTVDHTQDEAIAIVNGYASAVRDLAAQGVQVVVLPEKIVGVTSATEQPVSQAWASLTQSAHVPLVAGAALHSSPMKNLALVYASDGTNVLRYQKRHLVPGIEREYEPGQKIGNLGMLAKGWAVAVCKDMDFPSWLRRYGQEDARLLFAPALDFDIDARLHSRSAIVRSVENGFALARAANRGYLTLSDAYGRVVAEKSAAAGPLVSLVGDLSPGPGRTFYSRFGNWFAWLCGLLLVGLCVKAIATKPTK